MSFWSGERLNARLTAEKLIEPFNAGNIDCAAYTLTLGGSCYTSGDGDDRKEAFKKGKTPGEWKLAPDDTITIRSGQFAFLLTEESVTIPDNAVGFISVKAKPKFSGLINVSGFHVDPGWSGPLIFAVFNAGPHELIYRRGQKLFLLFYADLDDHSKSIKTNSIKYDRIPTDLIEKMAGDVPSLYRLNEEAREQNSKIATFTTEQSSKIAAFATEQNSKIATFTTEQSSKIGSLDTQFKIATGVATIALTISLAMLGILGKLVFFPLDAHQSQPLPSTVVTCAAPEPATSSCSSPKVMGTESSDIPKPKADVTPPLPVTDAKLPDTSKPKNNAIPRPD